MTDESLERQIEKMEEWRRYVIHRLRQSVWLLLFGFLVLALGTVIALGRIGGLAETNQVAIAQLQALNRTLTIEQYNAELLRWQSCNERNSLFRQQLRQDTEQLTKLVQAHVKDRDPNAVAFWRDYLAQGQRAKLPLCGKQPDPPILQEGP